MLNERVMHLCFSHLLATNTEYDLKLFCLLMTEIGSLLDRPQGKEKMEEYFKKLNSHSHTKTLSHQSLFTIQNLLDLRHNNWIPRRGDVNLQTKK